MATKKRTSNGWKPGQSGNPAGKPRGTRNKATLAVLALMESGAKEITEAVIEQARAGDLTAARMILDRLAPPARERPVTIDLPDAETAEGINAASLAVLQAAAAGEITPGEGATLAGIVEGRRKALETLELERRIAALEAKNGNAT